MRIICTLLICALGVCPVGAAEKRHKPKSAPKTAAREILKPHPPFAWGDTVVEAVAKLCAMQPLPARKSFGTKAIGCDSPVDLDVTADVPLYIFGPEQNVSLLNYKGIGIQVGTGLNLTYSPVLIHDVAYEATLQFNSVSEGHGAYLYDTRKDSLPWMLQKGTVIYLPVVLTSLRLTPLRKEGTAPDFRPVMDEFKSRYGRAFVRGSSNDKYVFYWNGTWLHVYDDGDIFYDGETYLKSALSAYDRYDTRQVEPGGVR